MAERQEGMSSERLRWHEETGGNRTGKTGRRKGGREDDNEEVKRADPGRAGGSEIRPAALSVHKHTHVRLHGVTDESSR